MNEFLGINWRTVSKYLKIREEVKSKRIIHKHHVLDGKKSALLPL